MSPAGSANVRFAASSVAGEEAQVVVGQALGSGHDRGERLQGLVGGQFHQQIVARYQLVQPLQEGREPGHGKVVTVVLGVVPPERGHPAVQRNRLDDVGRLDRREAPPYQPPGHGHRAARLGQ
jgi:hypothetical protein